MADIMDYNEKDTLLVFEIIKKANIEMYVDDFAFDSSIALYDINAFFKRIKYPLMCLCEKILLLQRAFMSYFKETKRILKIPIMLQLDSNYDFKSEKYDALELLGGRLDPKTNKYKYPGGVN